MSLQPDRLDQAFESLRSRSADLSQSFSNELEERLMREQQKQMDGGLQKRRVIWSVVAICGMLFVGAASYAATGGWSGWLQIFWIDSDGIVTDKDDEPVGVSFQNEDGSYTTIIQSEGNRSYEMRTDDSPKGTRLQLDRVGE